MRMYSQSVNGATVEPTAITAAVQWEELLVISLTSVGVYHNEVGDATTYCWLKKEKKKKVKMLH